MAFVVTGANRPNGVGFALVQRLLADPTIHGVVATARQPDKARALKELSQTDPRLLVLELDVDSDVLVQVGFALSCHPI